MLGVVKPPMPIGGHLRCLNHPVISDIPACRLTWACLSLFIIAIAESITADKVSIEAEKKLGDEIHVATFVVF